MRLAAIAVVLAIQILPAEAGPEAAVREVLEKQVRAWNDGDLEAFARTYSAETVFVGKDITRGGAQVLERYRRNYPTRERMGTLRFFDVEVRILGSDFASVLGRFRLERNKAGGGNAEGVFTLLLQRSGAGWRIILDHTS